METTQTTTEEVIPFQIHQDFYLLGEIEDVGCPFCGYRMSLQQDANGENRLSCTNGECSYLNPTVHEVVAALEGQGHNALRAAQIAAKYSAELDEDAQPLTAERFTITDYSSADWVLKKLAGYERRHDRMMSMRDAEVAAIDARTETILRPLRHQIEFFQILFHDALAEWTRKEIADQNVRSVKLLHGQTGYRRNPDSVDILDETAAIAMGEERPELAGVVKVVKSISRTNSKRVLGEIPSDHPFRSCVSIKPGKDVFYVKAETLKGVETSAPVDIPMHDISESLSSDKAESCRDCGEDLVDGECDCREPESSFINWATYEAD